MQMFIYHMYARSTLRVVVAVFIAISLWSCSSEESSYLGRWHAKDVDLTITKNGDTFVVASQNPRGFLHGKFVGTATEVGLRVNAGIVGEQLITYSKESDTLEFAGITFERVKVKSIRDSNSSSEQVGISTTSENLTKEAVAQVRRLSMSAESFYLDTGRTPSSLNDLVSEPSNASGWKGPYVQNSFLIDPWGTPYIYASPGKHGDFDIYSLGADGQWGGSNQNKDITSW